MSNLFEANAPRVLNLPAGSRFLSLLAQGLIESLFSSDAPEELANAIIYVPNRRSARALAYALFKANGEKTLLLPDIRALGDLESSEPPPSAELRLAPLPPILPAGRRLGGLARLVLAYFSNRGTEIPAAAALSAARELASLLDQAALSGDVNWDKLGQIVEDQDLAHHWEDSAKFLEIISTAWPNQLEQAMAMDPFTRRLAAAEALARHWCQSPPKAPVIIAGSTGATPASRVLMQAALQAPRGLIVLPGLDPHISPTREREIRQTPSHPQFTLLRALDTLGLKARDSAVWPGLKMTKLGAARGRLIHEALAPAAETAGWTRRLRAMAETSDIRTFVTQAVQGLDIIAAADEAEEARLSALLLRQIYETPDQTAALVTPDAGLARRVSALLRSYNIHCPPSAGYPLSQTKAGSFALLIGEWLCDPTHPEKLLAVLRHELSQFGEDAVNQLDRHLLRGPRLWRTPQELLARVARLKEFGDRRRPSEVTTQIEDLLSTLEPVLDNLAAINGPSEFQTAQVILDAITATALQVGKLPSPWIGEDGAALSKLFSELLDMSAPLGPIPVASFIELLTQEMVRVTTHHRDGEGRIAIWGPLEARLQSADHIILAGLNEGIWPAQPAADAFLPRRFRTVIGLSDPDERVGLSAHDFAQLACAPRVSILHAARRDDKPAVASRWVWRLRMLIRGALDKTQADALLAPDPNTDPRMWLSFLKQAPPPDPNLNIRPTPRPPLDARPKKLSVTRIETLIRDPYAIYCESILKLRRLDKPCLVPDARHKGTAIHSALEAFENAGANWPASTLLDRIETELAGQGVSLAEILALRAVREKVVGAFLDWHGNVQKTLAKPPLVESKGELEISLSQGTFKLTGTADRIDFESDQTLAIYDFKSGAPPTEKQVKSGLAPQMPLLGLIAQEGAFEGLKSPLAVSRLAYIRFGSAFEVKELKQPPSPRDLIQETKAGLIKLLTGFENPEQAYLNAPVPERVKYASDYDRLSRRDEWLGLDTYD